MTGGISGQQQDWIVDAAPIVVLAKIGRLDLLSNLARQAVEAGWGTRVAVRYIRVAVRSFGPLGLGEQSVLSLALKRPGSHVVLDDGQARRAAKWLGLSVIGTVGVIVLARRRSSFRRSRLSFAPYVTPAAT